MNRTMRSPAALTATALLLAGCSGGGNGGSGERETAPPAPTTASAAPAYLRVTTAAGGPLLTVDTAGATTRITSRLGGAPVTITGTDGRYAEGGRVVAVAKSAADGVKLKDTAGRTLWRAKVAAGQVRIRRGESDTRYEFRREADGRIKVKQGQTEVGDVRPEEQGAKVETADGATVARSGAAPSPGLAVLLCREVPPDLRAVLAAALAGQS
ncbi:hypothetical protein [Actinoallomurus rhizosphaericola]|uniref:hypothetical protein n=1 Tax=Actinoallomurus rhizosphaericola TaxID=2952536 RepID=UPI0020919937|nr:hypothetical protein [Actinoallomurus rhizosphaericola]MCO5994099.1 hypothetical protein [Actinoallomurus rhizosphaericola]